MFNVHVINIWKQSIEYHLHTASKRSILKLLPHFTIRIMFAGAWHSQQPTARSVLSKARTSTDEMITKSKLLLHLAIATIGGLHYV